MSPNPTELAACNRFLNQLEAVDLAPIARLLTQTENWTDQQVKRAIMRYKQFLYLIQQYPHQRLVPDRETDQVLHAHLATAQFTQDCHLLFGTELMHENGFGTRGKADRQAWLAVFDHTKNLIERHFDWQNLCDLKPARCVTQLAASASLSIS